MANTPGLGSLLKVSISTVFTTVARQVRHSGPGQTRADIDTTVLTDTTRQFIAGIRNGGEVTMEGYMDYSDSTQVYLDTSFASGTIESWKRIMADSGAAEIAFSGYIKNLEYGSAEIDQLVPISITIKVTGAVTVTT